jgi:hypothetical protein
MASLKIWGVGNSSVGSNEAVPAIHSGDSSELSIPLDLVNKRYRKAHIWDQTSSRIIQRMIVSRQTSADTIPIDSEGQLCFIGKFTLTSGAEDF